MDTRENGKGVFMIWPDEEELGFQSKSFEEFKSKIEERVKKEEYFEFDFFRTSDK